MGVGAYCIGGPAWKYCTLPDKGKKYQLRCNFCQQLCSGGITRVKYHLAHIPKSGVAKCGKVPTDVKDMTYELLTKNKAKKQSKCKEKASARAEVNLSHSEESEGESSSEEEGGNSVVVLNPGRAGSASSSKGGPMERFCKPTVEDATAAKKGTSLSNKVQTKLSTQKREERRDRACEYISQFFYEASIPHNVVNLPSFDLMLEAIGDFGRYLKGPSSYELSGPLLKKAKDKVRDSYKKHKEQWALTGCSLMTDAWTDKKGRGVMNLVVHSNYGVYFVDSVDCSSVKKDGKYIFELVDKCIEEIGEKNVVQVAKRPSIFWNGCAAHIIDLMLEDIGKIKQVDQTIVSARSLTAFLYSHTRVLALMREFLGKDLVRAGVTRFATAYLNLKSMLDNKKELQRLFRSDKLNDMGHLKKDKGKNASKVVRCKDIAKRFENDEKQFKAVWDIIDKRWDNKLKTPLHLAGYYLNPYYYYPNKLGIELDGKFREGLVCCITKMVEEVDIQDKIIDELSKFQDGPESFGKDIATRQRRNENFDPAKWWLNHGTSSPNLRKLAIRILSLTCSSSDCERNWSVFEQEKKENRRIDPIEKKVADVIEDEDNEWITGVVANVEQLQDPEAEGAQKQDGVVSGHGKRKKVVCTRPRKRTRKIIDITEGNEDEPELDSSSDTEDDDQDVDMAETLSDHSSDSDDYLSEE
ncbi:hypothetical protein BS78_07G035700 [Paspalum vaginatum]|nr:hypothetical protein BS78_07G035700 [Paspalum vaginatum]